MPHKPESFPVQGFLQHSNPKQGKRSSATKLFPSRSPRVQVLLKQIFHATLHAARPIAKPTGHPASLCIFATRIPSP